MPQVGTIQEVYSSPKTLEWTIPNFFELPRDVGYSIGSPVFSFDVYRCRLLALPNGTDSFPGVTMLMLTGIGKPGTVKWEIEINRVNHTLLRKSSGIKMDGCLEDMNLLIPYKEIRTSCYAMGFLRVTCTLYSELERWNRGPYTEKKYKEESTQTETTKRTDKLSRDLEELLLNGDDSNLTIRVKGQEFKAHKSILGARNPVFTCMFSHEMSENVTGVLNIDDCEPDIFGVFLHYLYTGTVTKFSPETVFDLCDVADKYQVLELKADCLEFIKNNLTIDIFCDAILISVRFEDEELMEVATNFLSDNMTDIMDTEKWQNFLSDNPIESNKLLLEALRLQK